MRAAAIVVALACCGASSGCFRLLEWVGPSPDADPDAAADGDGDADADVDGDADGDVDTDADADADADVDTDIDVDADTDGDGDGDVDSDADVDTDVEGDGDTDADVDVDRDEDVDADPDEEAECVGIGHDEDADGIDDACDFCPTIADPLQADSDEDGLGDACEWPGAEGLLSAATLVDTFHPLDAGSYTATSSGEWSAGADGDSVEVTGPGGTWHSNYLWNAVTFSPVLSLEATFSFTDPGAENFGAVTFAAEGLGAGAEYYTCGYDRTTTRIQIWHGTRSGPIVLVAAQDVADTSAIGDWYRIRADLDSDESVICRYANEPGDTGEVSTTIADLSGYVGIRVYDTPAVFSSFVVYQ